MNTSTIASNSSINREIEGYSSSASIIRTLSLTKVFPSGSLSSLLRFSHNGGGRAVVDNLNLTVPRGAIYGYLGPNGAGKTTTIKMLVGLLRPTRGTASLRGYTIHDHLREAQRLTGYMPDTIHRFPAMKAIALLETLGQYSGLDRSVARSRALDMLSWACLDGQNVLDTKVNRWSAGMQRKLLFIQAMLHKPDILILDEPTANLDPVARREFIELLNKATNGGFAKDWRATVLISSHDLPEVEEISTKIGFLNHGKLIAEGTKEILRWTIKQATHEGTTIFVVSGTNLIKIVKEIRDRLDATVSTTPRDKLIVSTKHANDFFNTVAGIVANHPDVTITDIAQEEENLESIFLKLEKLTRVRDECGERGLEKKSKVKGE